MPNPEKKPNPTPVDLGDKSPWDGCFKVEELPYNSYQAGEMLTREIDEILATCSFVRRPLIERSETEPLILSRTLREIIPLIDSQLREFLAYATINDIVTAVLSLPAMNPALTSERKKLVPLSIEKEIETTIRYFSMRDFEVTTNNEEITVTGPAGMLADGIATLGWQAKLLR